jgi:hypothetical protein
VSCGGVYLINMLVGYALLHGGSGVWLACWLIISGCLQ